MAGHPTQLPLRIWSSKPSSLISEPKEIVFVEKSQRGTSSLLISANYKESSPKPVSSYRATTYSHMTGESCQMLPHAFTALGSGPTSGLGLASGFGSTSGSGPAFTASGSDPAFAASGFGPAFGFWPRIGLRPHFWASALHRASAPLLRFGPVSGLGPALTAFGPRPSIYCFWAPAQHLLHS
ncbi:hypothetical protein CRG98_022008, partial [Punica granatum]